MHGGACVYYLQHANRPSCRVYQIPRANIERQDRCGRSFHLVKMNIINHYFNITYITAGTSAQALVTMYLKGKAELRRIVQLKDINIIHTLCTTLLQNSGHPHFIRTEKYIYNNGKRNKKHKITFASARARVVTHSKFHPSRNWIGDLIFVVCSETVASYTHTGGHMHE